jgi:hypothetical protein
MAYRKDPRGRSKPHVVSCRLDTPTYRRLRGVLDGSSVQAFLERLILEKLEEVEGR